MPAFKKRMLCATVLLAGAALSGCADTVTDRGLPVGTAAYTDIAPQGTPAPTVYQISPTDVLTLTVFDEPQISNANLRVDELGNVQVALAGEFMATGRTVGELSDAISARLRSKYIVDPHVTVTLQTPAKRYVSVEGEVKMPGVYEITSDFTLLAAIARAQSTTDVARLDQVVILRTLNGQHLAARFNLKDIRGGSSPNPQILNNDVVVVGFSKKRAFWVNLLRAAPLFNTFVVFDRTF